MRVEDLDTPTVVVDIARVERNLKRWQDYCDRHGIRNRPHIKTHKVPELAHRQVALGAVGIACQKLGEAEVMADAGLEDILIPYNLLGHAKLDRARALARRVRLTVACDSTVVADGLAEAFAAEGERLAVMVEVDSGMRRCGVGTAEEAAELAAHVAAKKSLRFAGFLTYPAPRGTAQVQEVMSAAKELLASRGIDTPAVSGGGTPDMWRAHEAPVVTEYRVGTYIYYDRMQVAAGAASYEDCALTIRTTVVSRPGSDRAVLDAGSKTLTSDIGNLDGHGYIVEYPEARITKLSEEHAQVDLSACAAKPAVGEQVTVIPNHCCVVSNLFDSVAVAREGRIVGRFPIAARGLVR
ncbi:alanine racemase [Geminicoccaceae bacterium 1502E]|nr:alanine racemase [Geminicoccaceae bacterium 1502E]